MFFIKMAKELILGIDDSGRGPVIGPMVLAGVLADAGAEEHFRKLGVRDSKMLIAKRREFLADEIRNKAITFEIVLVHPDEIDGRNQVGLNLNKIEAIKMAEIINKINQGPNILDKIKVIVDCPSPNTKKWGQYLKSHINNSHNLELCCEHKADINHVSCSAASIIAKTTRDAEIKQIKQKLGVEFGSGYPSDPITRKFLEEYFSKHKKNGIFRVTWGTVKDHLDRKAQKKLGDF